MKYIVYLTRNNVNGKIYIGVHGTENPFVFDGYYGGGVSTHDTQKLKHPRTPLECALKKYGFNNFSRSTIQSFDTEDEAYDLEAIIVDEAFVARPDTYNTCVGGGAPPNLSKQVFQYNLDGSFVCDFKSCEEASKVNGVSATLINHAAHYKTTAGGHYWSYQRVDKLDVSDYVKIQNREVHVYGVDRKYVKSYKSINECKRQLSTGDRQIRLAILKRVLFKGCYLSFEKYDEYPLYINPNYLGKVFKYDLSGKVLAEYLTASDACKGEPLKKTGVCRAIKTGRAYKGYLWSRGQNPVKVSLPPVKKRSRKVGRYSLDETLLEVFESTREARKKYGHSVPKVLSGAQVQTKGFVFHYL